MSGVVIAQECVCLSVSMFGQYCGGIIATRMYGLSASVESLGQCLERWRV
jgi:hypothetical protein